MMRLSNSRSANDKGFTLLEVVVALALVALLITCLAPVVLMAQKHMIDNRNKLMAKNLSEQELEQIRSTITSTNYYDLPVGDFGPFLMGQNPTLKQYGSTNLDGSLADGNPVGLNGLAYTGTGPKFYVKTTVAWVDDPADGLADSPGNAKDIMPFDYKEIVIRVSADSAFSDAIVQRADFKTLLSMEGGEEPYSGVLVKVVHGWPEGALDKDRSPIFGASVQLATTAPSNPTDTAPWAQSMSYTTNSKGEALIPVEPTSFGTNTTKDVWVRVINAGYIEDPAQCRSVNARKITLTKYVTGTDYRRIEYPCTLTISLNGKQLADASPSWQGSNVNWNVKLSPDTGLPPGDNGNRLVGPGVASVKFENVWPTGQYTLSANLKAWSEDFNTGSLGWSQWQADQASAYSDNGRTAYYYNLWDGGNPLWSANALVDPRIDPVSEPSFQWYGAGMNRLLSPKPYMGYNNVSLASFAPVDVPIAGQSPYDSRKGLMLDWDQTLGSFSAPGDQGMVYIGINPDDSADIDSGTTSLGAAWRQVADLSTLALNDNTSLIHKEIKFDTINGNTLTNVFSDQLRLRFDSSSNINQITLDNLRIYCQYEKVFSFASPGQTNSWRLTQ